MLPKKEKNNFINSHSCFLLISLFLTLTVFLLVNNRFLPIQEGWFHYDAVLMRKGLVPYRDFFVFLQPVQLFIAYFWSLIGDNFLVARVYGIIERLIVIIALYRLISRFFSPIGTFLAVTGSIFFLQSDPFDSFYGYFQTTLLFFLLSLNCYLSGNRLSWFGVGFFGAMTYWTKQSNGLFVFAFFIFLVFWDGEWKQYINRLLLFLMGAIIPTLGFLVWLYSNQALSAYFAQVYGSAGAKGSFFSLLFAFWARALPLYEWLTFMVLAGTFFILIKKGFIKIEKGIWNSAPISCYIIPVFSILTILLAIFLKNFMYVAAAFRALGIILGAFIVHIIFFSLIAIVFFFFLKRICSNKKWELNKLHVLLMASFVWMYACGLSYQLESGSAIPALTIVMAYLYDRIRVNDRSWVKTILIVISLFFILHGSLAKLYWTWNWMGWTESANHAVSSKSIIPQLSGFELSSSTVKIYDEIYQDILANTKPDDMVYTFPHIPFFNYVTGRLQPTFSSVHYFDVCPDWIAIADARLIRETPPKMIVYMELPEKTWNFHEEVFRNGKPSGQRKIKETLEDLFQDNYQLIDQFTTPVDNWKISVWMRK